MEVGRRATIRLTRDCDNACVFCAQVGLPPEPPRALDELRAELERARAHSDAVTLVGGEPTLHPELPAVVSAAQDLGFRHIGLQTNGRRLFRPALLRLLADVGLTDLHLSVHGASAAAHDYHTGVAGSFAAAIATLAAARAAGLALGVTTVLTRSNARGLGGLAQLLATRGASAWCLALPHARGRAAEAFDRVMPRLGVAMPFALHALRLAEHLELPVFVRGAPSCVLGPYARNLLEDAPRAFGDACGSCPARSDCAGLDPQYLARFDGDELSPCEPVARAEHDPRLASLFVGPGELATPLSREIHASPSRARVGLPMLKKVQPALAEVPRAAGKRTGEALRELFKELYTDDESPE